MKEEGKVTAAIVGGGRTGTLLLKELAKVPYVELKGVADINEQAPGMIEGRNMGVYTTTSVDDIAKMGRDLDLIIEVTNDPSVKELLKKTFIQTGNNHTIIVHDLVARLMISMAEHLDELAKGFHPEDKGFRPVD